MDEQTNIASADASPGFLSDSKMKGNHLWDEKSCKKIDVLNKKQNQEIAQN